MEHHETESYQIEEDNFNYKITIIQNKTKLVFRLKLSDLYKNKVKYLVYQYFNDIGIFFKSLDYDEESAYSFSYGDTHITIGVNRGIFYYQVRGYKNGYVAIG